MGITALKGYAQNLLLYCIFRKKIKLITMYFTVLLADNRQNNVLIVGVITDIVIWKLKYTIIILIYNKLRWKDKLELKGLYESAISCSLEEKKVEKKYYICHKNLLQQ